MSSRVQQPRPDEHDDQGARQSNRPVFKQRCFTGGGYVDVAVFERFASDAKPDQPPTFYASAKKTFKDEHGWHELSLFQPHELLILARAATAAYDWIAEQQQRE